MVRRYVYYIPPSPYENKLGGIPTNPLLHLEPPLGQEPFIFECMAWCIPDPTPHRVEAVICVTEQPRTRTRVCDGHRHAYSWAGIQRKRRSQRLVRKTRSGLKTNFQVQVS